MSSPIRLVIADDHALVISGIAAQLSRNPAFDICATVSNGWEAIQACQEYQPDVLLLDIQMPDMDGIETARLIHEHHPTLKIIAITGLDDPYHILRMMQAGAVACLHKGSALPLDPLIMAVMAGHSVMPDFLLKTLLQNVYVPEEKRDDSAPAFTKQEYAVLHELMQGYMNKEIAQRLGLSTSTVKVYLSSIFRKLNVQTRTEAVAAIKIHDLLNPSAGGV